VEDATTNVDRPSANFASQPAASPTPPNPPDRVIPLGFGAARLQSAHEKTQPVSGQARLSVVIKKL